MLALPGPQLLLPESCLLPYQMRPHLVAPNPVTCFLLCSSVSKAVFPSSSRSGLLPYSFPISVGLECILSVLTRPAITVCCQSPRPT